MPFEDIAGYPIMKTQEYMEVFLVAVLFEEFKKYYGGDFRKTQEILAKNGVYAFILENYDFYHMVGSAYAIRDICECLGLPGGELHA